MRFHTPGRLDERHDKRPYAAPPVFQRVQLGGQFRYVGGRLALGQQYSVRKATGEFGQVVAAERARQRVDAHDQRRATEEASLRFKRPPRQDAGLRLAGGYHRVLQVED